MAQHFNYQKSMLTSRQEWLGIIRLWNNFQTRFLAKSLWLLQTRFEIDSGKPSKWPNLLDKWIIFPDRLFDSEWNLWLFHSMFFAFDCWFYLKNKQPAYTQADSRLEKPARKRCVMVCPRKAKHRQPKTTNIWLICLMFWSKVKMIMIIGAIYMGQHQ